MGDRVECAGAGVGLGVGPVGAGVGAEVGTEGMPRRLCVETRRGAVDSIWLQKEVVRHQ